MYWILFLAWVASVFAAPVFRELVSFGDPLLKERIGDCEIAILQNDSLGRVLMVDGVIAKMEKNFSAYHEMLVHPALMACDKVESILILGGSDGSVLHEVLRYTGVKSVVVVDDQPRLGQIIQNFFSPSSFKDFEDSRVQKVEQKIEDFFKESSLVFDCILCDLPLTKLPFPSSFYELCKQHLSVGGVFVYKSGSPFFEEDRVRLCLQEREKIFPYATFYGVSFPFDPGGQVLFAWSGHVRHRTTLKGLKTKMKEVSGKFDYYTPSLQKRVFQNASFK